MPPLRMAPGDRPDCNSQIQTGRVVLTTKNTPFVTPSTPFVRLGERKMPRTNQSIMQWVAKDTIGNITTLKKEDHMDSERCKSTVAMPIIMFIRQTSLDRTQRLGQRRPFCAPWPSIREQKRHQLEHNRRTWCQCRGGMRTRSPTSWTPLTACCMTSCPSPSTGQVAHVLPSKNLVDPRR